VKGEGWVRGRGMGGMGRDGGGMGNGEGKDGGERDWKQTVPHLGSSTVGQGGV